MRPRGQGWVECPPLFQEAGQPASRSVQTLRVACVPWPLDTVPLSSGHPWHCTPQPGGVNRAEMMASVLLGSTPHRYLAVDSDTGCLSPTAPMLTEL